MRSEGAGAGINEVRGQAQVGKLRRALRQVLKEVGAVEAEPRHVLLEGFLSEGLGQAGGERPGGGRGLEAEVAHVSSDFLNSANSSAVSIRVAPWTRTGMFLSGLSR